MEIVLFWIGLSIVGVAANARGREGILWFFLALVISPLIALLAVLVMERKNAPVCGWWHGADSLRARCRARWHSLPHAIRRLD
ncbi:hypothetical protein [Bradyrhizobium sp. AZCC 2289]|uniref:hypothetical protein n=1 Tax=Bradyrhizobium sp. AZCC 2289 TaxID=3117026 RepID=UPI002FEFAC9E